MIHLQNIGKSYAHQPVLSEVTWEIPSQGLFGLVGVNGAGKTTLLEIIAGLVKADRGTIELCHQGQRQTSRLGRVGFMPETPVSVYGLTVLQYLQSMASFWTGVTQISQDRVCQWMETFNLVPYQHKLCSHLSLGYRKRLGLCVALLHNPDYLLLDEPLSGLDPKQVEQFLDTLQQLKTTKGIIISSHLLAPLSGCCDQIYVLKNTQLVAFQPDHHLIVVEGSFPQGLGQSWFLQQCLQLDPKAQIRNLSDNQARFQLQIDSDQDLRPEIAQLVVNHGGQLLSLGLRSSLTQAM